MLTIGINSRKVGKEWEQPDDSSGKFSHSLQLLEIE